MAVHTGCFIDPSTTNPSRARACRGLIERVEQLFRRRQIGIKLPHAKSVRVPVHRRLEEEPLSLKQVGEATAS